MNVLYRYPYPTKPHRFFHGMKLRRQVEYALAVNAAIYAAQHRNER